MKLKLPNVTLLGVDCVNVERLQAAMDVSQRNIEFGSTKLLTSLSTDDDRLVKIPPIGSVEEYSRFCFEKLYEYVETEYVLLVQYDGFVLNPHSWMNEFLEYDYVGAPWLVADWSLRDFYFPAELLGKWVVGNGGFSLRSKRLLEIAARLIKNGKVVRTNPEDVAVCVWYKDFFEKEGIRFAPVELAKKFSVEGSEDLYTEQFGFHSFQWTNIDAWIDANPGEALITSQYRSVKSSKFETSLLVSRENFLMKIKDVFKNDAIEAHVFGSVARRDFDPYSDLDVWVTFEDEDIKEAILERFDRYSQIGDVIHVCEPPQNSPIDGVHSSILYKTSAGLLQVDLYLCPRSSSFQTEESKRIIGKIDLPVGSIGLNPKKVAVDKSYRIDFVLVFVFISIKNIVRKEKDALADLFREYGYLHEQYDITADPLINKEHTFKSLRYVISNLMKISNEKQKDTLTEIRGFLQEVESAQR